MSSASLEGSVFLGVDAEFFFITEQGHPISAHTLLPSREDPVIVLEDRVGAAPDSTHPGVVFHYDGVQAEFGIAESTNIEDILRRTQFAISYGNKLAQDNKGSLSLAGTMPLRHLPPSRLPPEVAAFGCDVDFISWLDGMPNPITLDPLQHMSRYAGTHLHIGAPVNPSNAIERAAVDALLEPLKKMEVVKVLDYLVGNTIVLLESMDFSFTSRRKVYGKAGTYRPTPYGIEYRVPSSVLLTHPSFLVLCLSLARESVRIVIDNKQDELFATLHPREVVHAINTGAKNKAITNLRRIFAHIKPYLMEENAQGMEDVVTFYPALSRMPNTNARMLQSWRIAQQDKVLPVSWDLWKEDLHLATQDQLVF